MKAAAYVRVSTQDQAGEDRYGLAAQREAIENHARLNGIEIVCWYSDDGISGATLERPALRRLLSAAPEGKFSAVVVAKLDRVARDLMAQLYIEKELLKHDIEVLSAAEPFRGQDPANVLFRQIIGAFAQFEKARIAERLAGGRMEKARAGGYAGGCAPVGYQAERGAKRLEVDPEKAGTVRRVFDLRDENPTWSLSQIAAQLNQEGHTTARGTAFHKMQVKRILDRRALYEGRYVYAGVEAANGQHTPILGQ